MLQQHRQLALPGDDLLLGSQGSAAEQLPEELIA